MLSRIYM